MSHVACRIIKIKHNNLIIGQSILLLKMKRNVLSYFPSFLVLSNGQWAWSAKNNDYFFVMTIFKSLLSYLSIWTVFERNTKPFFETNRILIVYIFEQFKRIQGHDCLCHNNIMSKTSELSSMNKTPSE